MTSGRVKKLTIVSQYYWPEAAATAVMLHGIAAGLVRRGVAVRVLTAKPSYHGRAAAAWHEVRDGVEIVRLPKSRLDKRRLAGQALNAATFFASAAAALAVLPDDGPILAVTCPPQALWLGPLAHALRHRTYDLLIHDLHPETAEAVGKLPSGHPLGQLWRRFNRCAFAHARHVIALGPCMKTKLCELYAPVLLPERCIVIPNWADGDRIRPIPRCDNPFARQHGMLEHFTLQLSGNLGETQDAELIIEAARRLQGEVFIQCIGEGTKKRRLQEAAATLPNLEVLDFLPACELPYSLTAPDAALITLRPGLEGLVMPSRLYGSLAAGVPVIAAMDASADVALAVRDHRCGLVCDGTPEALAETAMTLKRDPRLRAEMAKAARLAYETAYSVDHVADRFAALLSEEASSR